MIYQTKPDYLWEGLSANNIKIENKNHIFVRKGYISKTDVEICNL